MNDNPTLANPPADLEWRKLGRRCYVTEHNGKPWTLWASTARPGKRAWSGATDWYLHEGDERTSIDTEGRLLGPAGRREQLPQINLVRAQKLATWILANPGKAATMVLRQIEEIVLGDAGRRTP